jgi:hypothetical protein
MLFEFDNFFRAGCMVITRGLRVRMVIYRWYGRGSTGKERKEKDLVRVGRHRLVPWRAFLATGIAGMGLGIAGINDVTVACTNEENFIKTMGI